MDDFEDFISHAKLSTLPLQASQAQATPASGATQRSSIGNMKAPSANYAFATERQCVSQTALQRGSPAKKLLLIEDMPHYADAHQRQRLADLLGEPVAGQIEHMCSSHKHLVGVHQPLVHVWHV